MDRRKASSENSENPAISEKDLRGCKRMVDTDAAAEYLAMAKNTLEKMRVYGRKDDNAPRFVKIGRLVRYDIRDLDDYIDRNKTISTSEYCARRH